MKKYNYKPDAQMQELNKRQVTCGGFERRLIDAFFEADSTNAERLEKAFKGTWYDLTKDDNGKDLKA